MADLFKSPRSKIPRNDSRITRIEFEESEVGARKSHLPKMTKSDKMAIVHVKSGA